MAPSLGELDVDQPALPPGSRSIEPAIHVERRRQTAIPITHYRILGKQQPAATHRLVAKEWRAAPRRRLVLFTHCDHADGRARTIAPGTVGPTDAVEKQWRGACRWHRRPPVVRRRVEAIVRQTRPHNRGRGIAVTPSRGAALSHSRGTGLGDDRCRTGPLARYRLAARRREITFGRQRDRQFSTIEDPNAIVRAVRAGTLSAGRGA